MAIAVMGDDDESTSSLILRLGSLGFDAIHARAGSRAFARVLDAADIILCASLDDAEDFVVHSWPCAHVGGADVDKQID